MSMLKKDETPVEYKRVITDELVDEHDRALESELIVLEKLNKTTDRTDTSLLLAKHLAESRNLLLALREQAALSDYYRARLNNG